MADSRVEGRNIIDFFIWEMGEFVVDDVVWNFAENLKFHKISHINVFVHLLPFYCFLKPTAIHQALALLVTFSKYGLINSKKANWLGSMPYL